MEIFLCFFLLLSTYLLVSWEQTGVQKFLVGAGMAIATAVLFKLVAIFYCAATVLYVFFRARSWHTRFSRSLWIGVPTVIGLVLWFSMTLLEPERLYLRLARWSGALGGNSAIVDPRIGITSWRWLQAIGGNVVGWGSEGTIYHNPDHFYKRATRSLATCLATILTYLVLVVSTSLVIQLKEQRHVIGLIPIMICCHQFNGRLGTRLLLLPNGRFGRELLYLPPFCSYGSSHL